ncbi:restriction endonuclease subunit S [uncultured Alistipes sp.]|uniref:restriction endonuclease subunit S n=1 Tax=uncultured Alistipes sp. TaxID=538949 RepID=UPI00265E41E5|nr:restriction endonuclease subunit S [uncultured Alistipes sp.]
MSEWKTYKWGDLISLEYGKPIPDKNLLDGQYPVYGTNGRIGTSNLTPLCKHPSIIVGRKGAYRGVHYSNKPFSVIDTAFFVEPKTSILDLKWAYYKLLTVNINKMDSGSAIPSTDRYEIYSLSVELPSLDEQRRIAGILGSLDDKIELNRRINANLEAQAQALFRSWFVDFEPFRDGPFVDSELGKIPQGWKVGDIYTYMDVIYGAPYKSALFNTNKKGYPLIRIRDLKTYSPQFYTEEILPNTEYVDFGDIVAGMDAEFVPYIWKGEKGLLNQRVCKFIPKYDYVSKYYILSLIRPELEFVQSYKVGTTVSHLGKSDIDKFKVITPPAEIVKRFSRIVGSFHQQIIKLAKENLNLSALRDTLLPKLMAGEINVE